MAGVRYLLEIQLTIYIISVSLGPGSALGEKGSKTSASEASPPVVWGGRGWPFPPPQTRARLTSLLDIFPISPLLFAFFRYCGALSQAQFLLMINSSISIMSPLRYFLSPHFFSYGPMDPGLHGDYMDPRDWALTPTLPHPFQME